MASNPLSLIYCKKKKVGVLSKQAFQRGLMIVEELGKGLGFMFGMSEREREGEVEIASCNLTVS